MQSHPNRREGILKGVKDLPLPSFLYNPKQSQSQQSKFAHANSFYSARHSKKKMVLHMFEKWQAWGKQKAAYGGFLSIQGWRWPLLPRARNITPFQAWALLEPLSLPRLNPARLLYVGRWSFDLIPSEILPFLLITNCFTLNTQQHKISPQSTPHRLSTPQSLNQSPPFVTISLSFIFFPVLISILIQLMKSTVFVLA